ncbi:MAG: GNAT family N-acetyltransferase [Stackebrandtia sp.]
MGGSSVAPSLPMEFDDGLVLRNAVADDESALTQLQAGVHADPGGKPNAAVGAWTRDLFSGRHPTVGLEEILVVEDRHAKTLASSLTLVPQRWSYAGVSFGVGRVELVATHPDYRRRGLVDRLLRQLHDMSARRGDLMQAITDLMFFHGELGYHMALTQRAGRGGDVRRLPPTDAPVRLRLADESDLPELADVDAHARRRSLLSCPRDGRQWEYELTGRGRDSMVRDKIFSIDFAAGLVGYVVVGYGGIPTFPIPHWLPGLPCPEPTASVSRLELSPDVDWLEIAPSVLRQLAGATGSAGYMLWLGEEHPAYDALGDALTRTPPHVGWFVRIGDMAAFLRRVAPALERRLSAGAARGFTGDLRLHCYTYGLALRFDRGRLDGVEPWPDHSRRASDVSLPEQMLVQLALGHAAFDQLAPAYPDCRMQTRIGRALVPALFPRQPSAIWPIT